MTERSDKKNISDDETVVQTRYNEKRETEERVVGAFPGHVGLMKIHGFSIGAIKSTTSLPLLCSSLQCLFSRDSFSRDRNERRAYTKRLISDLF